jgi:phage terminase large subunit-like protein
MRTLLLCSLVVGSACANDLRVDHPFDGNVSSGPLVSTQVLMGDVKLMNVDATNKNSQVYVDLDEGREMKVDEAFSTNGWDLAFKRYEISMNGGAGNPMGSVRVAVLQNQDFDALTQAPADGYQQDGAAPIFNSVDGGWYFYDLGKHQLVTVESLMYVVQSSAGKYFKLKMISYYDAAGTPASLTLKYAPLAAP